MVSTFKNSRDRFFQSNQDTKQHGSTNLCISSSMKQTKNSFHVDVKNTWLEVGLALAKLCLASVDMFRKVRLTYSCYPVHQIQKTEILLTNRTWQYWLKSAKDNINQSVGDKIIYLHLTPILRQHNYFDTFWQDSLPRQF